MKGLTWQKASPTHYRLAETRVHLPIVAKMRAQRTYLYGEFWVQALRYFIAQAQIL